MKTQKKIRKIDMVFIEWEDAAKAGQSWMAAEEIPGFIAEPFLVRSCGFLLEDSKKHIVLAADVGSANDFKHEQWAGVFRVPRPWIKKFKKLGSITI